MEAVRRVVAALSFALGIAAAPMGISCNAFGFYLIAKGDWGGVTGVAIGVLCWRSPGRASRDQRRN